MTNKFKVGEIVYIKIDYGQNQNIIGCGVITAVKNIDVSREGYFYNVKFVDSDGETLVDFIMNNGEPIEEANIYKLKDFGDVIKGIWHDLDFQWELTEKRKQHESLQNIKSI